MTPLGVVRAVNSARRNNPLTPEHERERVRKANPASRCESGESAVEPRKFWRVFPG
jgi:hypothetical protein